MHEKKSGRFQGARALLIGVAIGAVAGTAVVTYADLTPFKDYQVSDAVWRVSTIKVDPNMGDAYLEGLKKTWFASMDVAKKLGQVEEYHLFRSDLPGSGEFNFLTVVKFKNSAEMAPNKAKYEAFMKEWGTAHEKENKDIAQKNYPAMRKIVGEYTLREVTLAPEKVTER
jgi:hypothetical protein